MAQVEVSIYDEIILIDANGDRYHLKCDSISLNPVYGSNKQIGTKVNVDYSGYMPEKEKDCDLGL